MSSFNPHYGGYKPQHNKGIGGPPRLEDLWPGYLSEGYFDDKGNFKVEYVSRKKVEPLVKAMCKDGDGRYWKDALTSHQIRRYFGHCRAIETRLKSSGVIWSQVFSDVKKIDIAAADGAAKSPPKIPLLYHDFIQRNVAAIKTENDFLHGFLPHFEALVGFGQTHFKKERN